MGNCLGIFREWLRWCFGCSKERKDCSMLKDRDRCGFWRVGVFGVVRRGV